MGTNEEARKKKMGNKIKTFMLVVSFTHIRVNLRLFVAHGICS